MLKLSEEQLAERVVGFLNDLRWEVYQEVTAFGPVADIVAVQGPQVWIVECKTTFGLKVCSQAYGWKWFANKVSVAVQHRRFSEFEETVLRHCGVGAITVRGGEVCEVLAPALSRKVGRDIRGLLTERHKTYAAAGNAHGRRWTPFQETCDGLRRYVQDHPGCSLKEAIDNTGHHYGTISTARSCMRRWIDAGCVKGVRMEREGRLLRLYRAEPEAPDKEER